MYLTLTLLTIVLNAAIGIADLLRASFVLATSEAVDVPPSWLPTLGGLKLAGAAGLLLGLEGFRVLALAAAIGLALFYVGGIVAHLRVRKVATAAAPAVLLALAAATALLT